VAFAVIAAGGSGDRLGGALLKFEADLLGKPLIRYSLDALEESSSVQGIVLVVPAGSVDAWDAESLRSAGVSKALATVAAPRARNRSCGAFRPSRVRKASSSCTTRRARWSRQRWWTPRARYRPDCPG